MLRRMLLLLPIASFISAAVTRVEVTERADLPIANYERLTGKVYFAVDQKLEANRIITDIDRAPRNAQGLVEFSADLYMLKPRDAAKSNGTALLEVSNRGGRGMLSTFDLATGRELRTPQDFGDPLLFEAGYPLIWICRAAICPDRPPPPRLHPP